LPPQQSVSTRQLPPSAWQHWPREQPPEQHSGSAAQVPPSFWQHAPALQLKPSQQSDALTHAFAGGTQQLLPMLLAPLQHSLAATTFVPPDAQQCCVSLSQMSKSSQQSASFVQPSP